MCGRFYLKFLPDAEDVFQRIFNLPFPQTIYPPILDDDILPYPDITTIYTNSENKTVIRPLYWHLIPKTSKTFEPKGTWFNTRKEKLGGPYQEGLLRFKRCVIPVNGFFENKKVAGKDVFHNVIVNGKMTRNKERYEFTNKREPIMALGGIFDVWRNEDEIRYSCSIITRKPNGIIGDIHDRMPFIIPRGEVKTWLDRSVTDPEFLRDMIRPYPSMVMERKRVWPPPDSDKTFSKDDQLSLL